METNWRHVPTVDPHGDQASTPASKRFKTHEPVSESAGLQELGTKYCIARAVSTDNLQLATLHVKQLPSGVRKQT